MNANKQPHPFTTFNFAVEIKVDPVSKRMADAAFSECDGLEMTMEVKTIREGGANNRQYRLTGPVAYGQLTLKRGMTGNWDLWDWFREVSNDPKLRADVEVVVYGKDRTDPVMSFLLTRCVPIKLKAPALNAAAGGVAIEELQLAYETLELKERGRRVEPPVKAQIQKLDASGKNSVESYTVQFNPDSLKVTFANQTQPPSGNAPRDTSQGTSATQFVGRGTTKLSLTLWFDVTAELTEEAKGLAGNPPDVRALTAKIVRLMATQPTARENQPVPPSVRFLWGSFQFDGIIDSIDQSLEFFSPQGVPLRASLALSMSQAVIDYKVAQVPSPAATTASAAANGQPANAPAGTRPNTPAPAGSSLQAMASAQGKFGDWQAIAAANNIENPRLLATGQLVDMNARREPKL